VTACRQPGRVHNARHMTRCGFRPFAATTFSGAQRRAARKAAWYWLAGQTAPLGIRARTRLYEGMARAAGGSSIPATCARGVLYQCHLRRRHQTGVCGDWQTRRVAYGGKRRNKAYATQPRRANMFASTAARLQAAATQRGKQRRCRVRDACWRHHLSCTTANLLRLAFIFSRLSDRTCSSRLECHTATA